MNDSTVMDTGLGFRLEDAIGRAEADWYCREDTRPLRRAIAEDVFPLIGRWLTTGTSDEVAKLWAETQSLKDDLDRLAHEAGWYRAAFPDAEYPGPDRG